MAFGGDACATTFSMLPSDEHCNSVIIEGQQFLTSHICACVRDASRLLVRQLGVVKHFAPLT